MSDGPSFKERVKHEREEEILKAALAVFAERGFEHASIDDIAERVGIGKGTVYLHFASKEEVLVALMEGMATRMKEQCQRRMSNQPNALAKLHTILEVLVAHRCANAQLMRLWVSELPHFIGSVQHKSAGLGFRQMIAEVVEEGKAAGLIHPSVNTLVAAKTLPFLVFVTGLEGAKPPTKQQLLESSEQLYFHGVSAGAQA